MFSRLFRGRRSPPLFTTRPVDAPIRIDEARLQAWALALGNAQPPERRPHRSMLPDVDFARAVPAPRRPGPVARLAAWLLRPRRRRQPADSPAVVTVAAGSLPARWTETVSAGADRTDGHTMISRDRAA